MKYFLFILLLILIVPVSATSHDYYADIDIYVSSDGVVSIDGITNHPSLNFSSTQEFTSKNKAYWILNISIADNFSGFIYRLHLPTDAVMNYFKSSGSTRIESGSDGLLIVGTGENKTLSIVTQYQIQSKQSFSWYYAVIIFLFIMLVYIFVLRKKKQNRKTYNIDSLTKRQRDIIYIVEKSKKVVTQAQIEKKLKIPKSSLSRNINSLIKKGVIIKENKGISNIITLNKK